MSETTGISKYVIGLSGGIDSAVVACLLVEALGKDNVVAINMPTQYNSDKTKLAAEEIAFRLGIRYIVSPIEKAVQAKTELVSACTGRETLNSLTKENIQAKIRGTLLSDVAGELGAFFSCNGNKDEIFLGYATLYGDWGGAIAPIGDLTKAEVYQMAEWINTTWNSREGVKPIVEELLNGEIEPSAELEEDQRDPIKIGYHCAIIEQIMDYQKITARQLMDWWYDGVLDKKLGIEPDVLVKFGMTNGKAFVEDLKWLFSRMRSQVFKRVQSVPVIVLSKTAFGYDLRESILPRFEWTEEEQKYADNIIDNNVIWT